MRVGKGRRARPQSTPPSLSREGETQVEEGRESVKDSNQNERGG